MSPEPKVRRILLIDDDPVTVKLAEVRLKASGYEVWTSTDAPGGLEKAMKLKPDLIILDVMMPIVNGYNFCRLLKSHHEHKGIPIVLLTSRSGDEDKKIGREVGADAYITKPFDMENLLNTIKDLVGIG
ncbi:MAG: hypothetical protein A2787_04605 [Omnitrophica WOR_2 bacterium RIFCSPHIGHO2_01_FULL_48_9]|nr:MAG: hypothetical protein A2787_04605 [Omnitrophica WOR_2 bacterium RIFCSPHIGHO2_01_FULL_48_9]